MGSNQVKDCVRHLTHLTLAADWSADDAGAQLNRGVNGDLRVLRGAYAVVLRAVDARPTPQGTRALSTLSAAVAINVEAHLPAP